MSFMPYVAMGATFMVKNFRAVAMDNRLFLDLYGCLHCSNCSIFDVFGEGVSCHLERNSEVFVTFDYFTIIIVSSLISTYIVPNHGEIVVNGCLKDVHPLSFKANASK